MKNLWIRLTVLLALCSILQACTRGVDVRQDKEEVRQIFEKYLMSVDTADLTLASQIWLQGTDTSIVTPFGRFEGWNNVRDGIYIAFLQKTFSERSLEASNLSIHVSGDTAWSAYDFTFVGKLANGQPSASRGWESHVYHKTDQGWRIVHVHYSVPPPRS